MIFSLIALAWELLARTLGLDDHKVTHAQRADRAQLEAAKLALTCRLLFDGAIALQHMRGPSSRAQVPLQMKFGKAATTMGENLAVSYHQCSKLPHKRCPQVKTDMMKTLTAAGANDPDLLGKSVVVNMIGICLKPFSACIQRIAGCFFVRNTEFN